VSGRLGDAARVRPQADYDRNAGVLEVEGVGVALRAVADDRDGLAVELVEISVVVVEHGVSGYKAADLMRMTPPRLGPGRIPAAGFRTAPAPPGTPRALLRAAEALPERHDVVDVLLGVGVQTVLADRSQALVV